LSVSYTLSLHDALPILFSLLKALPNLRQIRFKRTLLEFVPISSLLIRLLFLWKSIKISIFLLFGFLAAPSVPIQRQPLWEKRRKDRKSTRLNSSHSQIS